MAFTSRHELRRRLAQRRKEDDVPDALWSFLKTSGRVSDVMLAEDPEKEFKVLVAVAKQWPTQSQAQARGTTPAMRAAGVVPPLLDDYVARRGRAASEYLAARASELEPVRRFRSEVLGELRKRPVPPGRLMVVRRDGLEATREQIRRAERLTLSPAEAERLLASPAASTWSRARFQGLHIPVVGHAARVVREWRTMGAGARPAASGWWTLNAELMVMDGQGQQWAETVSLPQCILQPKLGAPRPMGVPGPDGGLQQLFVWPSSVLDELRTVSEWLADRYPCTVAQATWFILTGEPPWLWPVEVNFSIAAAEDHTHARVTLAVEPWVPEATVARIYRQVRRDMLPGRNRPLHARTLEVLRFVSEQERKGRRLSWPSLAKEWNLSCPNTKWLFKENWRHLRTYRNRALSVMFTKYHMPGSSQAKDEGGES